LLNSYDYSKQRFHCDTYCNDAVASAPWNGNLGMNIMPFINNNIGTFNCCIENTGCSSLSFVDNSYEYNEYLCETYRVKIVDIWEECPNVKAKFAFMSGDIIFGGEVNWSVTTPPQIQNIECSGCDCIGDINMPGPACTSPILEVTILNANLNGVESSSGINVTAEANTIECGKITDTYTIPRVLSNSLITTTSDCNEMQIKYPSESDVNGNVYNWTFFGYDSFASFSDSDKTISFNTDMIIQEYNIKNSETSDELPKVILYELKIENNFVLANNDTPIYGYIVIPECSDKFSLTVYPNPTSSIINVKINDILNKDPRSDDTTKENLFIGKEYFIVNSQLALIAKKSIQYNIEEIDVSSFSNGVYIIYVITDEEEIVSKKFTVQNFHYRTLLLCKKLLEK
jgi:hypothetical protein